MIKKEPGKKTWYLSVDELIPGDVLLSSSKGMVSFAIRAGSGMGRYSHAALYLGAGLYIEATTERGLSFGMLLPRKAESDPKSGTSRILANNDEWDVCHVYRHEEMCKQLNLKPSMNDMNLMLLLSSMAAEHSGHDYALLEQLGKASPLLRNFPATKERLLKAIGKLGADKGKEIPRLFCSALVAQLFDEAGFKVVSNQVDVEHISPSDLGDPDKSSLRHQSQLEVQPYPDIPNDDKRLDSRRGIAESHLAMMQAAASQLRDNRVALQKLDQFEEQMAEILKNNLRALSKMK